MLTKVGHGGEKLCRFKAIPVPNQSFITMAFEVAKNVLYMDSGDAYTGN